jgi:hypothetical protein
LVGRLDVREEEAGKEEEASLVINAHELYCRFNL